MNNLTRALAAAVLFLGVQGEAAVEVSCFFEDCLIEGWEVVDRGSFWTNQISCILGDCEQYGWTESQGDNEFLCRPGGCFGQGWEQFDRGRKLSETACNLDRLGPNCFTAGWVTYLPNGLRIFSNCINSDCTRWGWRSSYPNGAFEDVRCKPGGCFSEGWRVSP